MKKRKIAYSRPLLGAEEKKEVLDTLTSGWLTTGPKVKIFEKKIGEYIGCKYVKALDSCTSGLGLAVLASGVGSGDEVITTPFTFCATINAIIHSGAKPIFVDIDADTFNIDPLEIEKKITKRTKAILLVHYGGMPCDIDKVKKIAKKYKLKVIEDAAHALGAEYKGRKIGNFSDLTCFSFHATKNITTGEGGAVVSNNKKAIKFINDIYLHGMNRESWQRYGQGDWQYKVIYPGYKANMSDIHASLGIRQLRKLDIFNCQRAKIAQQYDVYFEKEECLKTQQGKYAIKHAYHLYPIVLNPVLLKINRDVFIEKLKQRGIKTSVHFIPIYKHPAYKRFFTKQDIRGLSNTERIYKGIISLPIYPSLDLKDVGYVAAAVKDIIKKNKK